MVRHLACSLALALALAPALGCSNEQPSKPSSEAPPRQPETETPPTKVVDEPERDEQPSTTESHESLPPNDGFFMAEGAPEPRACKVAADCKGDTIPDLDNPCCQDPRTLEPYARAYSKWLEDWRRDHCGDVTCPPPPPPSRPRDCKFKPDCVDDVCVDTC